MRYERKVGFERATVNTDTGEFVATLFTDGEASDGHILNIPGGRMPEKLPLFINHDPDPTRQMGSLFKADRTEHAINVRGVIETNGAGGSADIRRDLLHMMSRGHVSSMSGRWDAEESDVVRRVNLPSDHAAFVDAESPTAGNKRWGLFFRKWDGLEGSIVGLGADPGAVLRHIEDPELADPVREFWRSVAETPSGGDVAEVLNSLEVQARLAVNVGATSQEIIDRLTRVFVPVDVEPSQELDLDPDGTTEEEVTRSEADSEEEVASEDIAPTPDPVTEREEEEMNFDAGDVTVDTVRQLVPAMEDDVIRHLIEESHRQVAAETKERIEKYLEKRFGVVFNV